MLGTELPPPVLVLPEVLPMTAAERNLLFGLLALQNGLIDQDQLLAAFRAWSRDKGRSLAAHLVDRGDLDADQVAAVEAMVALHLKMHGGDAERSLAAIPTGRSTHASLGQLGDADIGALIVRLCPAVTQTEEDLDRTACYSVGMATSNGQRFRILRPHARGGLGAVFVALDSELHREVALKQILDQHADDLSSRQRFIIEAEITGGLEHPGIVPVYGLGTYGDGRPYYAMRFVRGDSLKEAIEHFHADAALKSDPGRRSLELRELLHRFVDVCNAIDYAHSRGVLHRDIKPANVIVGKHGETLVVDWGLAKSVGRSDPGSSERTLVPSSASGSAETLPGSALGTPAYMSPEQAGGDLGALGPRSDVYSLGATLYCLLTGKPPFAGDDAGTILRAVQRGEATPLRSLDPTIDPALEAVCKKAIALQPVDRYPTPKALAGDIERWMADEPLSAWREPFSRRARRWARRNRSAAMTVAAAVLVALAGTAVVLAVQTRANRYLREANQRTMRERDLARQNFDLAQENFSLARRAVDEYLTSVGQNPLLKEQGLHELRQELLEAALGYYRKFLLQQGDNPTLKAEAAAAYERVGDILIEVGRPSDALTAYGQALALVAPLARHRPSDALLSTAQVRLHADRLQGLRDLTLYAEAIEAFDRARRLGEDLLAAEGGTADLPEILARAYESAAFIFRHMKRIDDALRASLRAHALAERATRARPSDPLSARTLLWVSRQAANLLQIRGRYDEARRLCEEGVSLGKARIHDHPRDVEMRICLVALESNLGFIQKNSGRALEALKIYRDAADTLSAVARENPLLIRVRSSWAEALNNLSQLQTDLGHHAQAEQSARTAIDLYEAIRRDVPSSSYYRNMAGLAYGSLGKVMLKAGSHEIALAMLRKSVEILETSSDVMALYNLACSLALASTIPDPAGKAAADRQRQEADRAVDTIRRAIKMGFANVGILKNDPDFDSLRRTRPDFRALLTDLDFPADPFAP
jgi:serine/threonine-protein kinase